MPDIDVEALELTTPPASAPQTSYTPAVLVRNNGVSAVSAYGYLQLFDLDSGLQLHVWFLASSSIPAGETKNAYADATWSPLESDVGKEFVFSGWVSCEGDMVPENNPLDPALVTVTEEPPPPPPPVTRHASQHEDGGDDELTVDGLSGTLEDPQPYANHASKHQDGGDDEVNLGALSGQTADAQIPTTHGNERHVQDFALTAELTNHFGDGTPHNAALGPPWASKGGLAPSQGPSAALSPVEHDHGGEGCIDMNSVFNVPGPGNLTIGDFEIEHGCLQSGVGVDNEWYRYAVSIDCHASVTEVAGPGSTITFDLMAGLDVGTLTVRQTIVVPIAAALSGEIFVRFSAFCYRTITYSDVYAIHNTTPPGGVVLWPLMSTGPMDRDDHQLWRIRCNLAGTTTMVQANAFASLHFANRSGP